MKKGVSPVVATVLLIAIAVISAVAVWYWVAPMTGQQATPATTNYAVQVASVYRNATNDGCCFIDLFNNGGVAIQAGTIFDIRNLTNGALTGRGINLTSQILPGATLGMNMSNTTNYLPLNCSTSGNNLPLGSYILRASTKSTTNIAGYGDVTFSC